VIESWHIAPTLQPLKDEVVGGIGDILWILMATIGMVLLIACANVANLMLVRSESRAHEFAVRTALGAGRWHIAREVLVESLVLSLTGGVLGMALAYGGLTMIVSTAPTTLPRVEDISLDPRVVVFAVVISIVSSVLFGLLPAVKHATQRGQPLAGAARGASTSRERQRTRNALVVVQVALALVLLVGSGLMIRTFQALLSVVPGFATTGDVQTARVWVPPQQVREPERVTRLQHDILDRVAALPGVRAAAFTSAVPMEGPLRVWQQTIFRRRADLCPGNHPVAASSEERVAWLLRRHRHINRRRPRHHVDRRLRTRKGGGRLRELRARSLGLTRGSPRSAHPRSSDCRVGRGRRRRTRRPRGCRASTRAAVRVLAGPDGKLQRDAAGSYTSDQSRHPQRRGRQ
jgi:hypothetical protein